MDRTVQLASRAAQHPIAYDPPPEPDELHLGAVRVLEDNWTGASTVPSRSLYPHQWSWDSAFIAIGLRHLSPLRAQRELETLLDAQWEDGRIPHIVFNPSVPLDAYFPSPDFWRSSTAGRAAGAPRTVQTSGIVQPPVHALAAWLVHCADPGLSRARGFLTRVYPRLAAWHRYLLHRRDLGGGGLVSVVHPWEQGMDNSPCWDAPLARVTPAPARSFRRADLDHGAAEDRPTDLDYGRYVRLATDYRDREYADGASEFAVEDPSFNALLIASEHALSRVADELGATGAARRARAERLTTAMLDRLWDPTEQMFFCRDVRSDELIPERSVSGLLPLLLPTLPRGTADALVRTTRGPHFGLGSSTRLPPSYDLLGEAFDPHRYWRGPAWFNTSWLLERGLRTHGEQAMADALREAVLDIAGTSGFAEYVDPHTGEACGATGFGWTAALALDLLHMRPGHGVSLMGDGTFDSSDKGVRGGDRA
ncbi:MULTISPECIES: MGH1-like glycoside hydrolase domain-containing protein [unclassified Streptomyces]|uniref:MGH1-like glycoside hydrolase domain-containing protein n=1 Tax=unclassified Streptomyces TaxID=2593676 RepID=UPI00225375BE|nr:MULTISPECIES: trehalase family glycosidase [unclassified Streptomyces]MCX5048002.1 trehalase family glycosidase [Streptomyces sp. NBC_00474]MCX5057269.1 trehalase family glycosidase [Streptomyces sp. NBC_00452]MCX5245852.1 trehalase family glycosidase [Streptomyces sp. NBC_00201]MCX5288344.1 trehalase family glycosidase [Streptomyces sp. NBC_00183]